MKRCLAVLLFPFAGLLPASGPPPEPLDPHGALSWCGTVAVAVDPTTRYGAGPAHVTIRRNDVTLFDGQWDFSPAWVHPFADGAVAAAGYTTGYDALRGAKGELVLALMEPDGTPRWRENLPRAHGQFITLGDAAPYPRLVQAIGHPGAGRVVFRVVAGPHVSNDAPLLRIDIDAPSGRELRRTTSVGSGNELWQRWLALPGTSSFVRYPSFNRRADQPIDVIDLDEKVLWSLPATGPHDWTGKPVELGLNGQVMVPEAGLAITAQGDLRLLDRARNEWMEYPINHTYLGSVEVGEPSPAEAPVPPAPPPPPAAPPMVTLGELGEVTLATAPVATDATFSGGRIVAVDAAGNVLMLRTRDAGTSETIVRATASGRVLDETAIPPAPAGAGRWEHLAPAPGGRVLLGTGRFPRGGQSMMLAVALPSGRNEALPAWDGSGLVALDVAPDGHVAFIEYKRSTYSAEEFVGLADPTGRVLWRSSRYQGPAKEHVFSPRGVCFDHDGHAVMVLSQGPRATLVRISREGTVSEAAIDVAKAAGVERVSYPTDLGRGPRGGFLWRGGPGSQWEVCTLTATGAFGGAFIPASPEGHPFHGFPTTAPDGSLWAVWEGMPARLGDGGRVAGHLGQRAEGPTLGRIAALAISGGGAIAAIDEASGALWYHDAAGRVLWRADARRSDGATAGWAGRLAISDAGTVWVEWRGRGESGAAPATRFSADGTTGEAGSVPGLGWSPVGDWQSSWVAEYNDLTHVGANGATMGRVERTAGGRWIRRVAAHRAAADGTVAVLAGGSPRGPAVGLTLSIHGPAGELLGGAELPRWLGDHARLAWDGTTAIVCGGAGLVAYDAKGTARWTARPWAGNDEWWTPQLVGDGGELWLAWGGRIRRLAMPGEAQ